MAEIKNGLLPGHLSIQGRGYPWSSLLACLPRLHLCLIHYSKDRVCNQWEFKNLTSVAELTDRETCTEINNFVVTGQARRHWKIRHSHQMDLSEAETFLERALQQGNVVMKEKGGRDHFHLTYPAGERHEYYIPVYKLENGKWRVATLFKRKKQKSP